MRSIIRSLDLLVGEHDASIKFHRRVIELGQELTVLLPRPGGVVRHGEHLRVQFLQFVSFRVEFVVNKASDVILVR